MNRPPRQFSERRGRRAETLAAWFLRVRGYGIVARRLRTPVGEIDIVARRGSVLAIVEVKARDTLQGAAEALTARQRSRLKRATDWLLAANPEFARLSLRFDVVLVMPRRLPVHLADAWRPD